MTIVNPTSISPLPTIPNSATDTPTFDVQWETFNTAIGGAFRTGTNNAASASYENALDAAGSASAANTSAGTATTQAGIATTQVALATAQASNAAASAVSAVNAPGTSGTSATSLTVSAGTQTFTTQTGKAWVVGQPVSIARTSAPGTTCMYGTITAYDSGTGSMSALVGTGFIGAGTFTDWTVGLSGTGLPLKTVGGVSLLGVGDIPLTVEGQALGFRHIPQVPQSAAYTLVLTDAGKHILHPSADTTARIFTIPANSSTSFPIGAAVTFVNQNSAGTLTISIANDVMRLAGVGTTGSRTLAANGVATAVKLTTTEWIISGSGLT